ncbi:PREDICTED: two-component response regulator-like APRR1 isoform X2 [Nelumbo nucifera]|uniref:Two-component response regulator-like APRR1 isoform X2 n=1 Tax=Nelumbo nucifera TaxID=4432 RepID=A0A1U7ZZG6_NELNU|nr:PREDICTED: two-component response regulator-like APRR1 isoform X2 [Nelumbo nucifera]
MYEHGDLYALSCSSPNLVGYPPDMASTPLFFPAVASPPTFVPGGIISYEFDSIRDALAALKSEVGSSGSSSSSYGTPNARLSHYVQRPSLIHRSMSSHSLQNNEFHHHHQQQQQQLHQPIFSSFNESRPEALELETCPMTMRKVYSTGDLQAISTVQHSHHSGSPLSHENCSAEGSNKAVRYSAEERKERIERYRSKRNQRNFNKKIKYACRKTLADSRPRIRGRFARNEEVGENCQVQWNQSVGDEDEDEDDVWINFLHAFSTNLIP